MRTQQHLQRFSASFRAGRRSALGKGLQLRCKIRSYLRPNFSENFTDSRPLLRARSRLYRSRFLQPNTHFAAFFEIYKISIPLHRFKFKILANFRRKVFAIFKNSFKILIFFTMLIGFVPILMKISRNFAKFRRQCWFWISDESRQNAVVFPGFFHFDSKNASIILMISDCHTILTEF